jgi:two-component system, LytTR family, response regulator
MINAILVDDEVRARKTIASLIQMNCPDIHICSEAASVNEAYLKINEHNPDLVFLDIKLAGETGFDLLKKYDQVPFKIIFVSAYEEYAIKAFKFSALDYILKPVQASELQTAVALASQAIAKEKLSQRIETLFENLDNLKKGQAKRLIIKNFDAVHIIETTDLMRCHGEKNYTQFFLSNGNRITVSTTLKEYEDMLTPYGFVRTHQGHLVNIKYIEKLVKKDGVVLVMKDKTEIPVATRRKDEVMKAIESNR